eukprot:6015014-Prymnesium_polylepis.1
MTWSWPVDGVEAPRRHFRRGSRELWRSWELRCSKVPCGGPFGAGVRVDRDVLIRAGHAASSKPPKPEQQCEIRRFRLTSRAFVSVCSTFVAAAAAAAAVTYGPTPLRTRRQ